MDWYSGSSYCTDINSTMVSIHSYAENEFIRNEVCNHICWLGLTDTASKGTFRWIDGTPLDYTNWQTNSPNDYNSDEDVAHIRDTGLWYDRNAHLKSRVVCMRDSTTLPTMSSLEPSVCPIIAPIESPTSLKQRRRASASDDDHYCTDRENIHYALIVVAVFLIILILLYICIRFRRSEKRAIAKEVEGRRSKMAIISMGNISMGDMSTPGEGNETAPTTC